MARGQQGIGSIIILIAIVLASALVAVLFVQLTDQMRTKAYMLQKEQESALLDRIVVEEVRGVVSRCGTDECITHLIITVSAGGGSNPINLEKLFLRYITEDVAMEGIVYVPPEDLFPLYVGRSEVDYLEELNRISEYINNGTEPPQKACRATLRNVGKELGIFNIDLISRILDPFTDDTTDPEAGTIYTVLWVDCAEKGDTQSLLPGQKINIFYRVKEPIYPNERFTLGFGYSKGFTIPYELVAPSGFNSKVVRIYP